MADQNHESSESFYSVYSHHSIFNDAEQSNPQFHAIKKPFNQLVKDSVMSKIAQSNVHLDDAQPNSPESVLNMLKTTKMSKVSAGMENRGISTMDNWKQIKGKSHKQDKQQGIVNGQCMEDVHNISEIEQKPQNVQESMCLLKEIDCLSIEQVSPEELREIKKKIEHLKKDQFNLQSSLMMASQMLRNAKSRNTILQQELAYYRVREETKTHNKQMAAKYPAIQQIPATGIGKQHRYFQQQAGQSPNGSLNRLKFLYKQCSTNQSYCVYQNDGYKIEVSYLRKKYPDEKSVEVVEVKLTPHHHIASRRQFRFGLQLTKLDKNKDAFKNETMSYDGAVITQQFIAWMSQSFHINLLIHELDEVNHYHHSHAILVPLPITHFFEPRLMLSPQPLTNMIKTKLSRYSLGLSGSVSMDSLDKLKDSWWMGRFISCLGENQIVLVQINSGDAVEGTVKVDVYGKMNGKVVKGVIEYLSFYLVN